MRNITLARRNLFKKRTKQRNQNSVAGRRSGGRIGANRQNLFRADLRHFLSRCRPNLQNSREFLGKRRETGGRNRAGRHSSGVEERHSGNRSGNPVYSSGRRQHSLRHFYCRQATPHRESNSGRFMPVRRPAAPDDKRQCKGSAEPSAIRTGFRIAGPQPEQRRRPGGHDPPAGQLCGRGTDRRRGLQRHSRKQPDFLRRHHFDEFDRKIYLGRYRQLVC